MSLAADVTRKCALHITISGTKRIGIENVLDVGQQQFLMLLLVIESECDE